MGELSWCNMNGWCLSRIVYRFVCALVVTGAAIATRADLAPSTGKPWAAMDYGPTLSASIESALPQRNMTPKGIVIRVSGGAKPAYVLFDADLLRYSSAWTGEMIDWSGVGFDGSHRTWPQVAVG